MSWSGLVYVIAIAAALAGLIARRKKIALGAVVLLLSASLLRCGSAARGESLRMLTTDGGGARGVGRILDEGDLAIAGARALVAAGRLKDPDAPLVPDALARAYARMRAAEGDAPSPVVPTYLGLQSPARADVLMVEGGGRGAVIFLHGFAGGFALPCWQFARAAREAGLDTFCPSVGWRGDWWTKNGERTLANTVAMVKARGHRRIFLAGLSNGAVGAANLAPKMRFDGVILISGASRTAPSPGVPVLVVQGRKDAMSGAGYARAYAARTGGRYVELDAGHFAFLLKEDEAHAAIAAWLRSH